MHYKEESMPLFVSKFLLDIGELDNAHAGAYIRLLCYQWNKGSIPADPKKLAGLVRETPTKFSKIWKEICKFFDEKTEESNEPRLQNSTLEMLRFEKDEYKRKMMIKGRLGAESRWKKQQSGNSAGIPSANDISNASGYGNNNKNNNYLVIDISKGKSKTFENGKSKLWGKGLLPPLFGAPPQDKYASDIGRSVYPFLNFWKDYDKNVDKDAAFKKYKSVSEADREKIKAHIPIYRASQPEKQYRKNPATYINQKAWMNEIIHAERKETRPMQPRMEGIPIPTQKTETELQAYYSNPFEKHESR